MKWPHLHITGGNVVRAAVWAIGGIVMLKLGMDHDGPPDVLRVCIVLAGMFCTLAAPGAVFGRGVVFACWAFVLIVAAGCLTAGFKRGY
ncbi:MAG TPA: hypothetical protein VGN12_16975 [Pirellulales bacterium]|jgi:hypothetical protein